MLYLLLLFTLGFSQSDIAEARGGGSHGSRSSGSYRSSSSKSYKSYSAPKRSYSKSSYSKPSRASFKSSHSKRPSVRSFSSKSRAAIGVARDRHGNIKRSSAARNAFKKTHTCPAGGSGGSCKGYAVDHIRALKRGGTDAPSNMQWQTTEQAKAKDKWE